MAPPVAQGDPIDDDMQDDDEESDETDSSGGGMQLDSDSATGENPSAATLNPVDSIPNEYQADLTTRAPDGRSYGALNQPRLDEAPPQHLFHHNQLEPFPTEDYPADEASIYHPEGVAYSTRVDGHPSQGGMHLAEESQSGPANPRLPMTEEEHAALTVLNDDELLMMYAVKSGHTIPQTRRRFQAMLLAGGENTLEEELYSARFVIPEAQADYVPGLLKHNLTTDALGINNTMAYCVPAKWSQKLDNLKAREGERGWISPSSGRVPTRLLKDKPNTLRPYF